MTEKCMLRMEGDRESFEGDGEAFLCIEDILVGMTCLCNFLIIRAQSGIFLDSESTLKAVEYNRV